MTDLVKSDKQSLDKGTSDVPEWIKKNELAMSRAGLEQVAAKDMQIPRLKLAQKSSPEVEEDNGKYISDLRPGLFFNSLTREIYGKDFLITPLFVRKSRRYFGPVDQGSPTLCFSDNAETGGRISKSCSDCPHSKFKWNEQKKKNEKPDCTLFYSYLVIIHLEGRKFFPAVLSFKSTAIDAAQKFNTLMNMRGGGGMAAFVGTYQLTSYLETKGTLSYQVPKVDNAGWVSEQQMQDVENLYSLLKEKVSTVVTEAENEIGREAEVETEEVPF